MTHRRVLAVAAAAATAFPMLTSTPAAASHTPAAWDSGPLVNVAIDAPVSASSERADRPASQATDGNAATAWCPTTATATITADLGRSRKVAGFGITVSGTDPAGTVRVDIAQSLEVFHEAQAATSVVRNRPTWLTITEPELTTARYVRLSVEGAGPGSVCVSELRVMGPDQRVRSMAIGHDMSFAIQEAAIGNTYTDRGVVGLPEEILANHGANYVRLRLWVDPPGGYSNLDSVLAMAKRAQAVGMRLLLDFHYSDFWADPQTQNPPASWADQDLPTLAETVRVYTRDVLNALAAQGTPADMVQIGNEIRNGMLWPIGRIDWSTGAGWDNLGTLLRAGVQGAQEAEGSTPKIVIHFDQGGDNWASRWFYDHIVEQGVQFDVIGLSYYPFWHGTIAQLRANMADLATRYGKEIQIVETQYGWTLANGDNLGNFLWQSNQLLPGYPATPGGQLAFVSDLVSALAAVPNGLGTGLFYWQPEWIPGIGWRPGAGTPNDNMTLFDFQGRALPGVAFMNPLLACSSYAATQPPCTF